MSRGNLKGRMPLQWRPRSITEYLSLVYGVPIAHRGSPRLVRIARIVSAWTSESGLHLRQPGRVRSNPGLPSQAPWFGSPVVDMTESPDNDKSEESTSWLPTSQQGIHPHMLPAPAASLVPNMSESVRGSLWLMRLVGQLVALPKTLNVGVEGHVRWSQQHGDTDLGFTPSIGCVAHQSGSRTHFCNMQLSRMGPDP